MVDYATYGTQELAQNAFDGLAGTTKAILLANHGTLALGDDLDDAALNARVLEILAATYWRALAVGTPVILSDAEIANVAERHKSTGSRSREPPMTLVATIDAGGSGVKLGVVSLETWRTLATVRREYASSSPGPGLLEWDPAAWWGVIESALAEAITAAGEPPGRYAGIVCTGMRIPFVLVDDCREPVAPGLLAPDARGRAYVGEVREALGEDALYATTGHWSAPHFGLPKLLWFVREQTGPWRRTRLDPAVQRLAGGAPLWRRRERALRGVDVADARRLGTAVGRSAARGDGDRRQRLPPLCDAGANVGGLRPASRGAWACRPARRCTPAAETRTSPASAPPVSTAIPSSSSRARRRRS